MCILYFGVVLFFLTKAFCQEKQNNTKVSCSLYIMVELYVQKGILVFQTMDCLTLTLVLKDVQEIMWYE